MAHGLLLPVIVMGVAVSVSATAQTVEPSLSVEGTLGERLTEWAAASDLSLVVGAGLLDNLTHRVALPPAGDLANLKIWLEPLDLDVKHSGQDTIIIIARPQASVAPEPSPVWREPQRLSVPIKPDPLAYGDLNLDRVIVTTQLRAQRLAEVPVAVTAITGSRITREDLNDLERVSERTPGFFAQRQTDSSPSFVIRGIEAASGGVIGEPSVPVFVDGFDASRLRGANIELLDIERIEIVRGPQGTLFSRGAQTGAVAIYTRRAEPGQSERSVELESGSNDLLSASLIWNQPILGEDGALRLAVRRRERDGFRENLGAPGQDVNDDDLLAVRLSAAWEPSETLRLDLLYNHQLDRDRAASTKAIGLASPGGNTDPASSAAQNPETIPQRRRIDRVQVFVDWSASDDLAVEGMAGYRIVDFENSFDPDGTTFPFLFATEDVRQTALQAETRLIYDSGARWRGTFGASAFWDDSSERTVFTINEQLLAADFPDALDPLPSETVDGETVALSAGVNSNLFSANQRQSYSVFANGAVDLGGRWTVDAGLRLTWDTADVSIVRRVSTIDGVAPQRFPDGLAGQTFGETVTLSDDYTMVSPRLAVSYEVTDALNAYVSVSRGLRSGFPQPAIENPAANTFAVIDESVGEESLTSLEIGLKGRVSDRLSVDLAAFHFDYADFQTLAPPPSFDLTNGGDATGRGLEVSTTFELADRLDVFASYAWLDARYDRFRTTLPGGDTVDLSGNRFRFAPEHSFNAALDWGFNLPGNLDGFASLNYAWRSEYFFNNDNLPDERQDAFGLLDARIGVASASGDWRFEVYGENLLDEAWVRDIGNAGKLFGVSTAIPADPRVIGVRFRLDFE